MIRLRLSIELYYWVETPGSAFVFQLHAAFTARQQVVSESLHFNQAGTYTLQSLPPNSTRILRTSAMPGPFTLGYGATVDLDHSYMRSDRVPEVPVALLPARVLHYLYPSRYCQSDLLTMLATREFGLHPMGYQRVLAIRDWVRGRVTFCANTSDAHTSALDTLCNRRGVCRDFAHLMIALCRALGIPARFTTGIDYGADPALGPPDFHAYVEAYLGDRWYLFDPSGTAIPMGLVRFASGRDASDVAFATIFGDVRTYAPCISIEAVACADGVLRMPYHCDEAMSTEDA